MALIKIVSGKDLIKKLNKLSKQLGFKGVKSYNKMYGTAINTFGSPSSSMWSFTINLNKENLITGVEINSTYQASFKQILTSTNQIVVKIGLTGFL